MSSDLVVQEQPRTIAEVKAHLNLIQSAMAEVMQKDEDFGQIPGTPKPTLLKPGAEKLNVLFHLDPQYEITERFQDVGGILHYSVVSKCILYSQLTGKRLGSGFGSCTTQEKKYAFRDAQRKCPACHQAAIFHSKDGGWFCWAKKGGCGKKFEEADATISSQVAGQVPNPDLPDQYNTVLKMSNKRSLVAATLNVTGASAIFTQDLEDMPPESLPTPKKGPENAKPVEPVKPKVENKAETVQAADEQGHLVDVDPEQNKIVQALPQVVKVALKAIGIKSIKGAFDIYQYCAGDIDAMKQYCDEKLRKPKKA